MERAKKKKMHNIRVIITNFLMTVSVIAIASILTLLAMGFNLSKNGLEQSGLLQVKSQPNDATVEIDGQPQFYHTEMSKMLTGNTHNIVITKTGYSTWSSSVDIEPGLLTRIDWVRLFPLQRTIENVHTYETLRLVSTSPDKHYLALLPENSTKLQLIDIHADSVKYATIDLATFLYSNFDFLGPLVPEGQLEITQWSEDHTKFLLKWSQENANTPLWYLVDIAAPENSINLSSRFNFNLTNFTDLQIANANATKIWGTTAGNLHIINTDTNTISAVLLTKVEQFSSSTETVTFVATNDQNQRLIGLYKEGTPDYTTIQTIAKNISSTHVLLGNNWAGDWIAYTVDNRLFVRTGNFSAYPNKIDYQTIAENDLAFTPEKLNKNPSGRFVLASTADKITTIDIDLKKRIDFDFPATTINWLDNFILWTDKDEKLTIIDFNGQNRRELTPIASNLDLALTTNNRWLYFVTKKSNKEEGTTSLILQRERL